MTFFPLTQFTLELPILNMLNTNKYVKDLKQIKLFASSHFCKLYVCFSSVVILKAGLLLSNFLLSVKIISRR